VLAKKGKINEVIVKMKEMASKYEVFEGKVEAASQEISAFLGSDGMREVSIDELRNLARSERETLVLKLMLAERRGTKLIKL